MKWFWYLVLACIFCSWLGMCGCDSWKECECPTEVQCHQSRRVKNNGYQDMFPPPVICRCPITPVCNFR